MGMAEENRMTKVQALENILHCISQLEQGIETAVVSGTMTLRDMDTLNRLRTALSDEGAAVKESMVLQYYEDSREEYEKNKEEEIE